MKMAISEHSTLPLCTLHGEIQMYMNIYYMPMHVWHILKIISIWFVGHYTVKCSYNTILFKTVLNIAL